MQKKGCGVNAIIKCIKLLWKYVVLVYQTTMEITLLLKLGHN